MASSQVVSEMKGEEDEGIVVKKEYEDLFGSDSDPDSDEEEVKEEVKVEVEVEADAQPKSEVKKEEEVILQLEGDDDADLLKDATGSTFLARFSNIVGVQSTPFDKETYDKDSEEAVREQHVIRWRYKKGYEPGSDHEENLRNMESNARVCRWSDGSMTLQIGGEKLDVISKDMDKENSFLYLRHEKGGFLESCSKIKTGLSFVPSVIKSKARASEKRRSMSAKVISTFENPEMLLKEMEEEEERKLRDIEQMQLKQKKEMAKYGLTPASSYASTGRRNNLSVQYLEDDDEENMDYDGEMSPSVSRYSLASRTRSMGNISGEKKILNAKVEGIDDKEEQEMKRRKFSAGLDESDEEEEADIKEEEETSKTKKRKTLVLSDDEED